MTDMSYMWPRPLTRQATPNEWYLNGVEWGCRTIGKGVVQWASRSIPCDIGSPVYQPCGILKLIERNHHVGPVRHCSTIGLYYNTYLFDIYSFICWGYIWLKRSLYTSFFRLCNWKVISGVYSSIISGVSIQELEWQYFIFTFL